MATNNPVTDDELRAEVRDWLAQNWTEGSASGGGAWTTSEAVINWNTKVVDARWAVPSWPEEWYGRGLSNAQAQVIENEFRKAGAPGAGMDRTHLAANTVLKYGTQQLKEQVLRGLLTSEILTCLLYSEPGAGSDLAGIRTRADRDGDQWTVNGQKVWTSGAATADYGLLIARTDWDVPKHKGISYFLCPMKQSGVTVRPLKQITGDSHFNEVFIDNAAIPAENLLGELNTGWLVLQTALQYERSIMGGAGGARRVDGAGGLIRFAREAGQLQNPVIRQDIARAIAYRKLNDLNMRRALADMEQGSSSSLASIGKLAMSRILHEDARVRTAILGARSMLDGDASTEAAETHYQAFMGYFNSIGGGTDQIQRNIISERVLGLPKEAEVDRNLPFREVKTGPERGATQR